jgi:hypothetical protein
MLLSTYKFGENWCRKGCTFLIGINELTFIYACTMELYDILKVRNALGKLFLLHHRHLVILVKCPWLLRLSALLCMVPFLIFWMLSALPVLQVTLFQIKDTCFLVRCHAVAGGVEVWVYLFLTLALDGLGGQHHVPAAVHLGNSSSIHCMGGWIGPRAGLDRCERENLLFPLCFKPQTNWDFVVIMVGWWMMNCKWF